MNRMNPRYKFGTWLGMRNNSAECLIGNADGVFRAREIRRLVPQSRWDKEAINSVIGMLWSLTDGMWPVYKLLSSCRSKSHPVIATCRSQTRMSSEPLGCPRCKAQAHSDRLRVHIGECLRVTPQGEERLDRRSEVM